MLVSLYLDGQYKDMSCNIPKKLLSRSIRIQPGETRWGKLIRFLECFELSQRLMIEMNILKLVI